MSVVERLRPMSVLARTITIGRVLHLYGTLPTPARISSRPALATAILRDRRPASPTTARRAVSPKSQSASLSFSHLRNSDLAATEASTERGFSPMSQQEIAASWDRAMAPFLPASSQPSPPDRRTSRSRPTPSAADLDWSHLEPGGRMSERAIAASWARAMAPFVPTEAELAAQRRELFDGQTRRKGL